MSLRTNFIINKTICKILISIVYGKLYITNWKLYTSKTSDGLYLNTLRGRANCIGLGLVFFQDNIVRYESKHLPPKTQIYIIDCFDMKRQNIEHYKQALSLMRDKSEGHQNSHKMHNEQSAMCTTLTTLLNGDICFIK